MDSHAEASVELGAITRNIAALRAHVAPAAVMAVVKANGYGHGAVPAARAAIAGGADWLGVVHVAEALELRNAGLEEPILCLMGVPEHDHAAAIAAEVDLAVAESMGITAQLRHIANTAAAIEVPEARYDLVRVGGGSYGLATLPGGPPAWLRPAMTLRARPALVKRGSAGTGVSYGHRY